MGWVLIASSKRNIILPLLQNVWVRKKYGKFKRYFFLLDRVVYDESFHGHVDRGAVAQDCFQKGAKSLGLNHCKFSFQQALIMSIYN